MIKKRWIQIKNGNINIPYCIYSCSKCGKDVEESFPMFIDEHKVLCINCGFIEGLVSEVDFLANCGVYLSNTKVCVHDGEIFLSTGGKFGFEKADKDYRKNKDYKDWREAVFKRDNYTCRHCGVIGHDLNAHHIKSFKDFKKLRYDVENGMTLCVNCHRKLHKKLRCQK